MAISTTMAGTKSLKDQKADGDTKKFSVHVEVANAADRSVIENLISDALNTYVDDCNDNYDSYGANDPVNFTAVFKDGNKIMRAIKQQPREFMVQVEISVEALTLEEADQMVSKELNAIRAFDRYDIQDTYAN